MRQKSHECVCMANTLLNVDALRKASVSAALSRGCVPSPCSVPSPCAPPPLGPPPSATVPPIPCPRRICDVPVSPQLHIVLNTTSSLSNFLSSHSPPAKHPSISPRSLRPHRPPNASQLLPTLGGGIAVLLIARLISPLPDNPRNKSKISRHFLWHVLALRTPEGQLLKAEGRCDM